ncbi:MAG: AbrB/MazE/SpoVT family DNA-binding domain-containing protein [Chloroflexota bacterium]|nr:AbrB/MazE/SpoVT family DNA-binding domain-containing protein [Chloroflexota bacterium]
MQRKLFKTGNSVVVSLPKHALEFLGISEGAQVELDLDKERRQIVIAPASEMTLPGVDETFAHQVADFVEQYRPALEALAK